MGFEHTTLVVVGTDCPGSCKSNYHATTTMTTPEIKRRQYYNYRYIIISVQYYIYIMTQGNVLYFALFLISQIKDM